MDKYDWRGLADAKRYQSMPEKVREYQAHGLPVMAGGSNFFENFRDSIGYERFLLEMAERTPTIKRIFEAQPRPRSFPLSTSRAPDATSSAAQATSAHSAGLC